MAIQEIKHIKNNRLLRQSEVAEYLCVSESWLERQRWLGEGPPYCKMSNGKRAAVRYRLSDLEKYIQKNLIDNKEKQT